MAYRLGGMGGQCPVTQELKGPPRERVTKNKKKKMKNRKEGRKKEEKKKENKTSNTRTGASTRCIPMSLSRPR